MLKTVNYSNHCSKDLAECFGYTKLSCVTKPSVTHGYRLVLINAKNRRSQQYSTLSTIRTESCEKVTAEELKLPTGLCHFLKAEPTATTLLSTGSQCVQHSKGELKMEWHKGSLKIKDTERKSWGKACTRMVLQGGRERRKKNRSPLLSKKKKKQGERWKRQWGFSPC